jgi:2-dehydro-3-deoxyphosphooctonate aldolase (KDO 8-P synthase)
MGLRAVSHSIVIDSFTYFCIMNTPAIPGIKYAQGNSFFLLAGPCAIEGRSMAMDIAAELVEITNELEIPLVFKGSYRKANRSRIDSFTGIGDDKALQILAEIREKYGIPVVTDIHESHEAPIAAQYVDVLQIPAFLFRQTELLVAAAKTGKFINIKKGQFAGSQAMQHAMQKCIDSGNERVILTDRGNTFGYTDLVVDFRNIPEMQTFGAPVVMDITHSLQQPNQSSGVTGGKPQLIETIAKAAVAVGVDGLFIETHPNPSEAKSDGANMLPLSKLKGLLQKLQKIRNAVVE